MSRPVMHTEAFNHHPGQAAADERIHSARPPDRWSLGDLRTWEASRRNYLASLFSAPDEAQARDPITGRAGSCLALTREWYFAAPVILSSTWRILPASTGKTQRSSDSSHQQAECRALSGDR